MKKVVGAKRVENKGSGDERESVCVCVCGQGGRIVQILVGCAESCDFIPMRSG